MRKQQRAFLNYFFLSYFFVFPLQMWASATPEFILKKMDEVRIPSHSHLMRIAVHELNSNKQEAVFDVWVQGAGSRTLIRSVSPESNQSKSLFILGDEVWIRSSNLKRPVQVSLGQKLIGQTANVDIGRMRWHGDYEPKIQNETSQNWELLLRAKRSSLPYPLIRLWIEKRAFRPMRAILYGQSGAALKNITFGHYKFFDGIERPSEILFQDVVRESDQSIIRIQRIEDKDFPPLAFESPWVKL